MPEPDELLARVRDIRCFRVPSVIEGMFVVMHKDVLPLVNDLWAEIERLRELENARAG